jgi:hypothetical protein
MSQDPFLYVFRAWSLANFQFFNGVQDFEGLFKSVHLRAILVCEHGLILDLDNFRVRPIDRRLKLSCKALDEGFRFVGV